MGTQKKSAPAGGGTPVIPGLTEPFGGSAMTYRTRQLIDPAGDHRATCRIFLELAADDLTKAKEARIRYIELANKYGLTNVEIGDAVGISEARVRAILAGGE